jgi:hypothetical protein
MTTGSTTARVTTGVDWRRAEFVLTLLAFLGFITVAIKITTVYDGLPAHPLIVHVPVVTLRVTLVVPALAAAFCVFRVGDLGAKAVWQQRVQATQAQVARTGP